MNKASLHFSSFLLVLFSFLFCSCPNPLVIKILAPKTVTFETNGGSPIESQTIFKDYPIRHPTNPVRSEYVFDAWYIDNETFVNKWNFNTAPNKNITLYAKWIIAITTAAITVTGPATGETPDTTASGTGDFTIGEVSWTPNDTPFRGSTAYTASATLTANDDYAFAAELTDASINGNNATITNNAKNTLTLSYTFAETNPKVVTAISVKTQPAKLTYTHDDTLDLSELEVTLVYDDSTTEDVAAENFTTRNINTSPAHGNYLVHVTHNGLPVTITYGSLTLVTDDLTVNPKVVTFTVDPIPTRAYTGSANTPAVTVKDGATLLALNTDYTVEYTDNTNAGTVDVTITGVGNYAGSTGSANFIINKAAGTAVAAPTAATIGANSITLNAAESATGQTVEYGVNTTNTAPTNGWQTSTTFNGLTAVTLYYFFARSASNDNYETGVASAGTGITTKQQTGDDTIVNYWVDDTGEISIGMGGQPSPNNTVTVRDSGSVTFSAGGGGYSGHSWTFNGTIVGTGESYTFDASGDDKEPGRNYIIGLRVQKDGKYYFTQITVRIIAVIAVKTQPAKLAYTHGDTLDLSGLVVTLTYDDSTTEDVALNGFASKNISASPAHGAALSHLAHNNKPVILSYGGKTTETSRLAVANVEQQTGDDTIVNYWVDDTGEISIGTGGQAITGNTVIVRDGESVTFSADGGGYSGHSWTFNGTIVGTGESYTFDTSNNDKEPNRNYIIGLRVQKDGKYYFTQIIVRIEEE
jgi:uncharacterized repeat protein (TIGR02543 family)